MGSQNTFKLSVENSTRGVETLVELESTLKRIGDATIKTHQTALAMAGGIAATAAAINVGTAALVGFADAALRVDLNSQRALNAWRAFRLAVAAPGGTASIGLAAGTVATGLAVQKVIETTLERARQVQDAAFKAAKSGSPFQSAFTLQRASSVTGRDLGFLSGYSAADISDVTLKLRAIEDPILRAKEAISLFGSDGEFALRTLDGRLAAATSRAADLAEELDGPTRNSLNELKTFFDNLHPFQRLGDEFDNFAERFKIGVAKIVIDGKNSFEKLAAAAPQNFMVGPEGNAETAGFNPGAPVPSDGTFIRGGRSDAEAALGRLATPGPNLGGTALASAFRSGAGGTEGGIRLRLELIGQERNKLQGMLSSRFLDDSTFKDIVGRLGRIDGEQKMLNLRLAGITNAEAIRTSISDLEMSKSGNTDPLARILVERSKFLESLRKNGAGAADITRASDAFRDPLLDAFNQSGRGLSSDRFGTKGLRLQTGDGGTFTAFSSDIGAANPDTGASENFARLQAQAAQRERDLNTSFARQFVQFEERKIELLTGPGGELDAINRIYELKKAGLEQELEFGNEIFNLTERRTALDQERTLRILDLQRQRRDEARGLASDFTASLQAGDPGGFFRQQGNRLVNQVGTNLFTGTFQRAQGVLGKIGESSGLGSLLKGTLLDPANATPVDRNTLATDRNTAAIEQATIRAVTGAGAGGGGVAGLLTAAGVPAQIFAGASGSNPLVFSNNAGTGGGVTAAPGFIGLGTDAGGAVVPLSAGAGISKGARGVGIAGLVAGGAIGAYTQFKAGGAQGALNGTAALAGAASGILALSGVGGPAAPIIAGIGLSIQAIAAILGDPKKRRDAEINRQLDAAYYEEPTSMAFNFDRFGRGYDSNKRGDMRPIIIQNFDLIDGSGIMDRREFFADAVRQASYEGHGINRAMQEAVLPA